MTVLRTTQPAGGSHDELLRTFLDAQEDTVKKLVRVLDLLLARFQVQDLFSPRGRHGS